MPEPGSKQDRRRNRRDWRQQYGLLAQGRQTRRPLALWDRLKFSILFIALWFIVVWYEMSLFAPDLGFSDAARQQLQVNSGTGRWLILLLSLEVLRQLSYLLAERWRFYYRLSTGVFGRGDQVTHQLSDYTRFRLSRVIKIFVMIGIVAIIFGLIYHTTPIQGL